MTLPENGKFRWNYPALAFALPMSMMLVLMFLTSALPFGEYSLYYYSDEFHQYFPFFKAFRQALRSGQSILWSWDVGLGMDYLGLISYYLASPLNLFSVLIPDAWVEEYFALLMPIKLSLASMFFAIFLKKLFRKDGLSIVLFGSFYGMCAWALGYQWNIMWLDTFALLPLVMLGMVQLLRDKKFILYTVSLFLSIFSNYYVGFFVCIFVFITFFCYELCRFKGIWRFCTDLFRIGVFSLLAIGMTAILELPTLASLQDTYSSVNSFPEGFAVNILAWDNPGVTAAKEAWTAFKTAKEAGEGTFSLWWDAIKASFPPVLEGMEDIAGQIGGGQTLTYVDGLPNLYCGVFPVALAFLFLLAKDVRVRDKICAVVLLVFFMLSFLLRQLDYIWHGFHFTNQIPYRFSFLFSFVLLYMAYQAWVVRDNFKIWQILVGGALSVALLLVKEENRSNATFLLFNLAFLGLYLVLMLYGNKDLTFAAKKTEPAAEPEIPPLETDELAEVHMEEAADIPVLDEENLVAVELETEVLPEIRFPEDNLFEEEMVDEYDLLPPPENRRKYAAVGIACLMVLELVVSLINFASGYSIATYDYPKKNASVQKALATIRELEEGNSLFYRTEMTHTQTLNDGALNGYHGISTFTSSANVKTTEFMEALGYAGRNNWNRYCYEEASPVANLFLNLKYMIERDTTVAENAYFSNYTIDDIVLMRNNYSLPLGFLAESGITDVDFSQGDPIKLQNALFAAATGLQGEVWNKLPRDDLNVTGSGDVALKSINVSGYTSFETKEKGGTMTYTYTVSKEGFMLLDLTLYAQKNYSVYVNGALLYSEGYSLPCTTAVCNVKPGDVVKLNITCKPNTNSAVQVTAAVLDHELFEEGYNILKASTLQLTEFSTNKISGMIRCDRDGVLYTSIPQCGNKRTEAETDENGEYHEATTAPEGNWVTYVDGQRADITLVGDAMIGLELTEGVHTIEFRYENKAFTYGALISAGCLVAFGGIIVAVYCIRNRKRASEDAA